MNTMNQRIAELRGQGLTLSDACSRAYTEAHAADRRKLAEQGGQGFDRRAADPRSPAYAAMAQRQHAPMNDRIQLLRDQGLTHEDACREAVLQARAEDAHRAGKMLLQARETQAITLADRAGGAPSDLLGLVTRADQAYGLTVQSRAVAHLRSKGGMREDDIQRKAIELGKLAAAEHALMRESRESAAHGSVVIAMRDSGVRGYAVPATWSETARSVFVERYEATIAATDDPKLAYRLAVLAGGSAAKLASAPASTAHLMRDSRSASGEPVYVDNHLVGSLPEDLTDAERAAYVKAYERLYSRYPQIGTPGVHDLALADVLHARPRRAA